MRRAVCFLLICCLLCSAVLAYSNGSTVVYITDNEECYHQSSCRFLDQSKIAITLEEAVSRGYRACKVCTPPAYIGPGAESDDSAAAVSAAVVSADAQSGSADLAVDKRLAGFTSALGTVFESSLASVRTVCEAVRNQIS